MMKIRSAYLCAIPIFAMFLIGNISNVALGESEVVVSPNCGSDDINVLIYGNGFSPNSNIAWKLVRSDGDLPLTGYYQSDGNGEIRDSTTIDDVKNGKYKMYFGEDADNNGEFDDSIVFADVFKPCPK
jgi:hypothetical protein